MKTFRDAIRQQDFVVTASLPLWPATTSSEIESTVETLAPVVDAIQVADDFAAVGHMSPLAAASIGLRSGLDAVVNMSGRDRNRMALVADILGAAALGVTTLILSRGEKFTDSAIVRSKGVFEVNTNQLIELASTIGSETSLISDPGFYIGSLITVFRPPQDWDAVRVSEKLDSGVKFLQTRPCLNEIVLREYMKRLIDRKFMHRAAVIVDVPLLTSAKDAQTLKAADKGATIPDSVLKRIATAKDAIAEGVIICAEMISKARRIPGVSGVNICYTGDTANVAAAIRESERG